MEAIWDKPGPASDATVEGPATSGYPERMKEILNSLKAAAVEVENTYASDQIAPPGWHLREQLRKEIRGIIRRHLKPFKLKGWEKEIPTRIEEYALKNFIKVTN